MEYQLKAAIRGLAIAGADKPKCKLYVELLNRLCLELILKGKEEEARLYRDLSGIKPSNEEKGQRAPIS